MRLVRSRSASTRALGSWGYIVAISQILGFAFGGFATFGWLTSIPYCDKCFKYFSSKGKQKRYFSDLESIKNQHENMREFIINNDLKGAIEKHTIEGNEAPWEIDKICSRIELNFCKSCKRHHFKYVISALKNDDWKDIDDLKLETYTESELSFSKSLGSSSESPPISPSRQIKKNEKCHNHPQKDALSFCISCKKHFCADCLTKVSEYYCCGSENCKNILENKTKEALHSVIVSGARSLADDMVSIIDGGFSSQIDIQEAFNVMAVYVEIVFVCIHELMDITSQYLDEEEKYLFFGEIYGKIRDVLANKYSAQIGIGEFQAYFDNTFKERRTEYKNFVGLNPNSWAEDLLYMSFGKKLSNILGKSFDLDTDSNIHALYITAVLPMPLVRKHLQSLNDLKQKYHIA